MLRTLFVVAALLATSVLPAADRAAQAEATAAIEAALDSLTEVQYLETEISDCVTDLELRHRIDIHLDREAVEKATGQKLQEIIFTTSLKGLSLASVLNLMLPPKNLTWTIHEGVLLITSIEQEPKYVVTKVYPVGDFAPNLEALQDAIEKSIDPSSWKSQGGTTGAIARYDDTKSLVVTHTGRTQRRVAGLIDDLRAAKSEEKK